MRRRMRERTPGSRSTPRYPPTRACEIGDCQAELRAGAARVRVVVQATTLAPPAINTFAAEIPERANP